MYWKITSDGNRDESRSHYHRWRRPSFMATEHDRDEMVPAWIPGHPQWVFVFCPLKFDSTRLFLTCVSTQSSVSYFPALKPWAEVSGNQRVFLSLKIYCSLPVFEFSALSTSISVFIAKLKDSSICHAANPLQLLMVADVTGSDVTGWFPPWLGQLEQSSTEVNPFAGPWGSPRMGKGLGICKYTFSYLPLARSTGKAKSIH